MFDIIGKRRWFYIFSALIMIPGLIFILLTPLSDGQAGLKFSIDFTGGTVWEIHFARRHAADRPKFRRSWPSSGCLAQSPSPPPPSANTCSSGPSRSA